MNDFAFALGLVTGMSFAWVTALLFYTVDRRLREIEWEATRPRIYAATPEEIRSVFVTPVADALTEQEVAPSARAEEATSA